MDIQILYEDSYIIAVDKPAGISSIPERDHAADSLLRCLEAKLGQKLFVVHRLDKDVSGVMLYAKTAQAHRNLNMQFDRREVDKRYLALVHGTVKTDHGTIRAPLRQCGSGRVGVDPKRGKPAITEYQVKQRGANMSLLEVYPRTGRRHQIRVHLYSLGHPVVGDRRYGDAQQQKAYPRLMLHSMAIAFALPDGARRTITSPAPAEMNIPQKPRDRLQKE